MTQQPIIMKKSKNEEGGATAAIVGIIVIVAVFLFFFYGLPRIIGTSETNIQSQTSSMPQISSQTIPAQTNGGGY